MKTQMVSATDHGMVRSQEGTTIGCETLGSDRDCSSMAGRGAPRVTICSSLKLWRTTSRVTSSTAALGGAAARGARSTVSSREPEDLSAVRACTGATILFGHSYGG